MAAKARRSEASAFTSAPTSSMTLKPWALREGQRQAMAGRFTPGTRRSRSIDTAIRAPVLPQDTTACASPSRSASTADHMEVPLPCRMTCDGLSVIATTPAASTVATGVLEEAQAKAVPGIGLPLASLAAAVICCVAPGCTTGAEGDTDVVLASPIILYDYPAVAPESAGALFDATEIDEILTLRVMTLTDEEKAAARATDAHAAAIIDRCDTMSPEEMQRLHGILRDPHAGVGRVGADVDPLADLPTFRTPTDDETSRSFGQPAGLIAGPEGGTGPFDTGGDPWWDPAADASVQPQTDSVLINGVRVAAGSLVRVHPSRRADAQDLFFAGQTARVTSVLFDVDGATHVAVVLVDDPAAEMHDWYGRYLYFAPDELEPLSSDRGAEPREESRS